MALAQAARAAPAIAERDPWEKAQLVGLQVSSSPPQDEIERTGAAHLDAWTARALDAGIRLRRAAMAWNRSVVCRHAESIGSAFESIGAAKTEIDDIICDALDERSGPSLEIFAAAVDDYRASGASAKAACSPPKQRQRPTFGTLSSGAQAERMRLRREFPTQWRAGETAEAARRGPPQEFASWTTRQRDAFFAAAASVAERRMRERAARDRQP